MPVALSIVRRFTMCDLSTYFFVVRYNLDKLKEATIIDNRPKISINTLNLNAIIATR